MSVIIKASLKLENRVSLMIIAMIVLLCGQLTMAMYHLYHGSVLLAWGMLTAGMLQLIVPAWSIISQSSVAHRVRLGDFDMGAALAIRQLFDNSSDDINKIADYLPNQLLRFTSFSVRHLAAGGAMLFAYATYSCIVGYPIADIDVAEIRAYELMITSAMIAMYAWMDFPTMHKSLDQIHRKLDTIYLHPATVTITRPAKKLTTIYKHEQGVLPRST